ncbi:MAG: hypothetical protein V7604_2408 [Hyphomicrobiales bacterium]
MVTDAISVCHGIRDIATGVPSGGADVRPLLLGGPDSIAKALLAASAVMNTAVGGFRELGAWRAEAAVPGTQTVYLPGEGPEAPQAEGLPEERDYPSRSAIEAVEEALGQHREEQYAARQCVVCRAAEVADPSQHALTQTSEENEHSPARIR